MNHLKKIYAIVLAAHTCFLFAMEKSSRVVPSLEDICIAQVAEQVDHSVQHGMHVLRQHRIDDKKNVEIMIYHRLMSATMHLPELVQERVIKKWMDRYTWKMAPEKRVLHCYPSAGKYEIAWNHNGDLLASSAEDNNVIVWKYEDGEFSRAHELDVDGAAVQSMTWHPSKNMLAFGMVNSAIDIWKQNQEGQFTHTHRLLHDDDSGYSSSIASLAWHPSKDMLVAETLFNKVQLWQEDKERFECQTVYRDHIVLSKTKTSVSWHPRSDIVAAAGELAVALLRVNGDKKLEIIKKLCDFNLGHHTQIRFSPDHKTFVTGSNSGALEFYQEQKDGKWDCVQKTQEHSSQISSLSWHPNSSVLASGSWDQTMRIWAKRNGTFECEQTLSGGKLAHSLSWHPSQHTLAVGYLRGNLSVYDFTPTIAKIAVHFMKAQSVLGKRRRDE